MGDCHPVAGQRDPDRRVGSGIDEAQPDPLPRLGGESCWCFRNSAVDDVVGIGDVARVAAEQLAAARAITAHRPHAAAHGTHAVLLEIIEDLLR